MCVCFAISNLGGTYDGKACAGPGATTCSGGPDASKNTCLYYASREAGDARFVTLADVVGPDARVEAALATTRCM